MSGGVKCVVVDARLREIEPKALDFVLNFARDNHLQLVEACSLD
ncbi:Bacteriophage protein [Cupriavidus sp. H18C1]